MLVAGDVGGILGVPWRALREPWDRLPDGADRERSEGVVSTFLGLTAVFLSLWLGRKLARLGMVLTLVVALGHYALAHKVGLRHLVSQTSAMVGR